MTIPIPTGVFDILPHDPKEKWRESHLWNYLEALFRSHALAYGCHEIRTPIFERTELFKRSVGDTSDIVSKEMYSFEDRGGRWMSLRPEGTAPVMRAFIEKQLHAQSDINRFFYIGPMFRYERPQSGRFRQHHQFGVEFVGSKSPLAEVELITLITTFIDQIGLKDAKLHINSIGCSNCRKTYNEALLAYLRQQEERLCPTCRERMLKNPLRVLDCKVPACKEIVKDAPRTIEYLDEECSSHFEELKSLLTALNIPFEIDTGIVRGLDYYTKTVFEFVNSEGFTLCGGGRYDNLIHEIDEKQDIPSVGFGMGIERIIYFLDKENVELETEPAIELYIGILGSEAKAEAYKIVNQLKNAGIIVETDYMDRSVKAQMKYANKIGSKNTVIIGADELAANKANIKNMETGEQTEVALDLIVEHFIKG
jgi:histidyl-tRNA synthetase